MSIGKIGGGEDVAKKKLLYLQHAIKLTGMTQIAFGMELQKPISSYRMSDIICGRVKIRSSEMRLIENMFSEKIGNNWQKKVGGDIWKVV